MLFGGSSGAVPPFDLIKLSQKGSLFITRPTLGHYTATREELEWRANDVLRMIAARRSETANSRNVSAGGSTRRRIAISKGGRRPVSCCSFRTSRSSRCAKRLKDRMTFIVRKA